MYISGCSNNIGCRDSAFSICSRVRRIGRQFGLELTIEKLVYGGDGLARLPADEHGRGKTVFLPLVIPEERVDATVTETRSGFARARLNHLLTTSPHRVVPACPYFGPCGGCQYQHIVYPAQLRFKTDILRETLKRTAKLDFDHEIQLHSA